MSAYKILLTRLHSQALCYFRSIALKQLSELIPAPSVGMHEVPGESVADHLHLARDDGEARDQLDERLARAYHSNFF